VRTTGATDEQITAAAKRNYESSVFAPKHPWDGLNPDIKEAAKKLLVRDYAANLVPPDQRIVAVADLRAQRAGLIMFRERITTITVTNRANRREGDFTESDIDKWSDDARDQWNRDYPAIAEQIDRITALIGDEA